MKGVSYERGYSWVMTGLSWDMKGLSWNMTG